MSTRRTLVVYRLVTACLLVCLQLQAISTSIAFVQGPRHAHKEAETAKQSVVRDPLAGWQDFRGLPHRHSTHLGEDADPLVHASLHKHHLRHHHASADPSVVTDDASRIEESLANEAPQVSEGFVCIEADGAAKIAPAVEISRAAWQTSSQPSIASPCPWRIERPPQLSQS